MGTIILIALVVIILPLSVKIVSQQTVGIVETFGKYSRTLNPGLNFIIPIVQRVAARKSLRVQELNVAVTAKTKDQVFFDLPVNVQVKVSNAEDAHYKLEDAGGQMSSYILNQVRGEISNMDLEEVYQNKNELELKVSQDLSEKFGGYGYEIINVLIDDPELPAEIRNAANDVIASKRSREAATHKAEAVRITTVAEATAEAEAKKLAGKGYADQRKEIVNGYEAAIKALRKAMPDSSDEQLASIVSQLAWFDTQRDMVANNKNLVMMPYGPDMAHGEMSKMITSLKASK